MRLVLPVRAAADPEELRVALQFVHDQIDVQGGVQDRAVAKMLDALEGSRVRLLAKLSDGTEFDFHFAQQLLRETDAQVARLAGQLGPDLAAALRDAVRTGDGDMTAQAVEALPAAEVPHGFAGVDAPLLEWATQDAHALVGQLSATLRANLQLTFSAAATGSSSVADVARQVGTVLRQADRDPGVYGKLAFQVERVTRTEMQSGYSGAARTRMTALQAQTKREVRKRWLATLDTRTRLTHRELSGATIPLAEHFNVEGGVEGSKVSFEEAERRGLLLGYPADRPLDAAALPPEETIQCRCALVVAFGPRPNPA